MESPSEADLISQVSVIDGFFRLRRSNQPHARTTFPELLKRLAREVQEATSAQRSDGVRVITNKWMAT